jgi:hypothetical protein
MTCWRGNSRRQVFLRERTRVTRELVPGHIGAHDQLRVPALRSNAVYLIGPR